MRWFLVVTTLALAPTVLHAWEHGPEFERQRLRRELRRGWDGAARETRRAMAAARREMRRALREQQLAWREMYREARGATRAARRHFRW